MKRSLDGLLGAGEWHELKKVLPSFNDKSVLDLGCGLGWHCQYAIENGAKKVVGVDISEKMLSIAREKTDPKIQYLKTPIEDIEFDNSSFDVVVSSLAFHYIEDYIGLIKKIHKILNVGGSFVFSVEHPIFTAQGDQSWILDKDGNQLFWPVDNYFYEGERSAMFLGETVKKYHRTMTSYINTLIKFGFRVTNVIEPKPDGNILDEKSMEEELRRPMMLIISAIKEV